MAIRNKNSENILLQEGTICSALLLQDEVVICDGGTDALVLTGVAPSAEIDHYRDVGLKTIAFTGYAPILNTSLITSLGTATLTGKSSSAQVDDPCLTSTGSVALTGTALARINVANSGTSITNLNASTTRIVNVNACDYSGFQAKPGELLKNQYGKRVLPRFWEDLHPEDTRKPQRSQTAKGPLRPEPVGDEVFVGEVSVDDL